MAAAVGGGPTAEAPVLATVAAVTVKAAAAAEMALGARVIPKTAVAMKTVVVMTVRMCTVASTSAEMCGRRGTRRGSRRCELRGRRTWRQMVMAAPEAERGITGGGGDEGGGNGGSGNGGGSTGNVGDSGGATGGGVHSGGGGNGGGPHLPWLEAASLMIKHLPKIRDDSLNKDNTLNAESVTSPSPPRALRPTVTPIGCSLNLWCANCTLNFMIQLSFWHHLMQNNERNLMVPCPQ